MRRFILLLLPFCCLIHQAQARTEHDSILQVLDYELSLTGKRYMMYTQQ